MKIVPALRQGKSQKPWRIRGALLCHVSVLSLVSSMASAPRLMAGEVNSNATQRRASGSELTEDLLLSQCDQGALDACVTVGRRHLTGSGGSRKDLARAMVLFGVACKRGSREGCWQGGQLVQQKKVASDPSQPSWYHAACELGSAAACLTIGRLIGNRDEFTQAELYRKACGLGLAAGCQAWEKLRIAGVRSVRYSQFDNGPAEQLAFSADDRFVIGIGRRTSFRLWDAETAQPVGEPIEFNEKHGNDVHVQKLVMNKQMIAAFANHDHPHFMFDCFLLRDSAPLAPLLRGDLRVLDPVTFSADGSVLAAWVLQSSGEQQREGLQLWDTATGKLRGEMIPLDGKLKRLANVQVSPAQLAVSPDGKLAAGFLFSISGAVNYQLMLIDAAARTATLLPGSISHPYLLAFNEDGSRLVAGADDEISLWDVRASGKPLARYPIKGVTFSGVSPNGQLVAAVVQNDLILLNMRDLSLAAPTLHMPGFDTESLAFSHDGRRLALQSLTKLIVITLGQAEKLDVQAAAPGAQPLTTAPAWFQELHAAPAGRFRPTPPPLLRTGEVFGKVTLGEKPFAGATITLTPTRTDTYASKEELALKPLEVRSGADGSFRLTQVPKTRWSISAVGPKLQRTPANSEIELNFFNAVQRVDLNLVALPQVFGRVLHPTGKPAAGAEVRPVYESASEPAGTERAPDPIVHTGLDGRFVFERLRSGRIQIQVLDSSGEMAIESSNIDYSSDKIDVRDLLLQPASNSVRVRLIGLDGRPVSGAEISDLSGKLTTYKTAADGTWRAVNTLAADEVQFVVRLPGEGGRFQLPAMKLPLPGEIQIKVPAGTIFVRIPGLKERALAQGLLPELTKRLAYPIAASHPGLVPYLAMVDANGVDISQSAQVDPSGVRYSLLHGGRWRISQQDTDYGYGRSEVDLPEGGQLEVTVPINKATAQPGRVLVGRLVDSHGVPITNATVRTTTWRPAPLDDPSAQQAISLITGAAGRFRIDKVYLDRLLLNVSGKRYRERVVFVRLRSDGISDVRDIVLLRDERPPLSLRKKIAYAHIEHSLWPGLSFTPEQRGARIQEVSQASAASGKLSPGDLITEINGEPLAGLQEPEVSALLESYGTLQVQVEPGTGGPAKRLTFSPEQTGAQEEPAESHRR